ncbi:MAG: hypothetical protein HN403_05920 [Rhodospirillales bacterium]|jgi:hypothetical protein|nr:hypothetical protein [Rhodospirillales bacterium]
MRSATIFGLIFALAVPLTGCQPPRPIELPARPVISGESQTPVVDARLGKVTVKPFSISVANKAYYVSEYFHILEAPFRDGVNRFLRSPGFFTPAANEIIDVEVSLERLVKDKENAEVDVTLRYLFRMSDGTILLDHTTKNHGDEYTQVLFEPAFRESTNDAYSKSFREVAGMLEGVLPETLASTKAERSQIARDLQPESGTYRVIAGKTTVRQRPRANAEAVGTLPRGSLAQVVGRLQSGWLRIARGGKPYGWAHRTALRPEGAPPIVTTRKPAPRNFATAPLAVTFAKGKSRPDDIAVIVGNGDYAKLGRDIPDVTPAHADAESFKRYAMTALGVREGNIIDLRDATGAQLKGVFGSDRSHKGQLFDWVRPGQSRVWVYYAGHGAPAGKEGTAFLVPVDADAARIEINGYPLSVLYANLGKIPAKSMTVVLEACFSGASQAGTVISRASGIFVRPKTPAVPGNITVIAAGAADQIASWEEDKSHGLFTKYYLTGMSGEADKVPHGNGDSKVALKELDAYLDSTLTYYARRYYGRDQKVRIVVAKELRGQ